jgi:hypothetical protein
MASTNAIVKRSDAFGTYVQLRVGATETSEFVNGGVIFNGKRVQVIFTVGSFCQVRVQSDCGTETLVGFVKKEHLVFESPAEAEKIPGTHVMSDAEANGIEGFVETQSSETDMSSEAAREKFQALRETGSIEDRWKYLKAYIEAKQREVFDYHLQNVQPMEDLMSMKALEPIKERALE